MQDHALVDAVVRDVETAPIPEREKVLLRYIARVDRTSWELKREEMEVVRAAGWSDEAIYDAVSVCALFNFYNRWCDGAGVQPMALEHHAMSGKRLAENGYTTAKGGEAPHR